MVAESNLSNLGDELRRLRKGEFDFLDFGCSTGGSISLAKRLFDANHGLGIDISEDKVRQAVSAGHEAIIFDIKQLPAMQMVRFCVMAHFLEHIPNRMDTVAFIHKAIAISRDFVFIKQPFFDADGFLFRNGLKLYWSDWRGHPNPMTLLNFHSILKPLRDSKTIGNFSLHVVGPVASSSAPAVHSLSSPPDQHQFDEKKHPPKNDTVDFGDKVFTETMVLISKPGVDHYAPFSRVKFAKTIFDSSAAK